MVCIPLKQLNAVKRKSLTVTVRTCDEENDSKIISSIAKEMGCTKICHVSFWKHPLKLTDINIQFKNVQDMEFFTNAVKNLVFYDSNMEKFELQRIGLKNDILKKWSVQIV